MKDIEKQIGRKPKQYKEVDLPEQGRFLWSIYCALSPNFSLQELKAYCELTGVYLSPDQVDLICLVNKASYG